MALVDIETAFWAKVDRTGECWEWTGGRFVQGYGAFRGHGAHRVSWRLTNGAIPDGLQVLHHCDNPPCVRPDHLFTGTAQDNANDRIAKGRGVIVESGMGPKLRRVIYLSEEEWDHVKTQSDATRQTISAYIRSLILGRTEPSAPAVHRPSPVGTAMAQAERDAVLNRVNKGKRP